MDGERTRQTKLMRRGRRSGFGTGVRERKEGRQRRREPGKSLSSLLLRALALSPPASEIPLAASKVKVNKTWLHCRPSVHILPFPFLAGISAVQYVLEHFYGTRTYVGPNPQYEQGRNKDRG